jgi:hypothetical protein
MQPLVCFRRYLLVKQVLQHSQLSVAEEGAQLLESIDSPLATVVVIGPYRSGKSFLLNQLLGLNCGEIMWPMAPTALCRCGQPAERQRVPGSLAWRPEGAPSNDD